MKASAFEFRFRFLFHAVIFVLGFTAPWNRLIPLDSAGPNAHVWGTLAAHLSMLKPGFIGIATAFNILIIAGTLCAFVSASLRTWASAYLGASTVQSASMHGDAVVAAGPYRYFRNPLYAGIFIHALALALLMSPSGAIFCILALGLFELRLILGEEAFLTAKLGEPYLAYCARVPRLFPALTPQVPPSPTRPHWLLAFLSESYMWGAFVVFATVSYRYNATFIVQGILIALGVSIIIRAFLPKRSSS